MIGVPIVDIPMELDSKQTLRLTCKFSRGTYRNEEHRHLDCRTINQFVRTLCKLVDRKPFVVTPRGFSAAILDMAQHLPAWHIWSEDKSSIM